MARRSWVLVLAVASLDGCCLAGVMNSPEPCHEHAAQSQRFRVTGSCGEEGVIEIVAPAGSICDFTVTGAEAAGLPTEGSMYGPGTAPLVEGRWFLGWFPRGSTPHDSIYRQCRTKTEAGGAIELICEDRRHGRAEREVCRAVLTPEGA